jgi:hypothetical protein
MQYLIDTHLGRWGKGATIAQGEAANRRLTITK